MVPLKIYHYRSHPCSRGMEAVVSSTASLARCPGCQAPLVLERTAEVVQETYRGRPLVARDAAGLARLRLQIDQETEAHVVEGP